MEGIFPPDVRNSPSVPVTLCADISGRFSLAATTGQVRFGARRSGGAGVARWSVLLVDENDDFLDGLASWLVKTPGLEVVGRAHSGREAMARVEASAPHLVILDASLADVSGFEVARRIKSRPAAPVVVLMTFHESRAASRAALEAGADLCVSKTEITGRLLPAIADLMEPGQPSGGEGR